MERHKAVSLTGYIRTIRPEWDALATVEQLMNLTGTDDEIERHALVIAHTPEYRTPIALKFVSMNTAEETGGSRRPGNQIPCDICGRTEWACNKAAQNTGIRNHVYAPHIMTTPFDPDIPAALGALGPRRL